MASSGADFRAKQFQVQKEYINQLYNKYVSLSYEYQDLNVKEIELHKEYKRFARGTKARVKLDALLNEKHRIKADIGRIGRCMSKYNTLYEICRFLDVDYNYVFKRSHNCSFLRLITICKNAGYTFVPLLSPNDPHYYDLDIQNLRESDYCVNPWDDMSLEEFLWWYEDFEDIKDVIQNYVGWVNPVETAIIREEKIREIERIEINYILKHYYIDCRFSHHGATDRV